jgi:L-arabinokinase
MSCLKADAGAFLKEGHREVFVAAAPGRLDVMGGLTDYTGGLVCQMPLDVMTAVAVQRRDDRKLVVRNYNSDASPNAPLESTVSLSLDDFYGTASLLPNETLQNLFAGGRGWAAHIAGAFPALARHKKITQRTHGANIACYTNIPLRSSAASSAALCCATLWAITAAYHLILDPLEVALLAHRIETQTVGTLAGVVEPAVSMLGRKDQVLLMNCQPHELAGYEAVPAEYLIAGIQLGRKGFGESEEFTRLRVASFMAQAILVKFHEEIGLKKDPTKGYLANLPAELFGKYYRHILPETISGAVFLKGYGAIADRLTEVDPGQNYMPRDAAMYHVGENARARAFAARLHELHDLPAAGRAAGAAAAGQLLLESHAACEAHAGLRVPESDVLIDLIQARGAAKGFYGARDAGTGGTVTVFADNTAAVREELQKIAAEYQQRTGLVPHLLLGSAAGAAEAAPQRVQVKDLAG